MRKCHVSAQACISLCTCALMLASKVKQVLGRYSKKKTHWYSDYVAGLLV
jgi:hypothetical protein